MNSPTPIVDAFLRGEQTVRSRPVDKDAVERRDNSSRLTAWLLGTGTPSIVADRGGPATLVEVGDARVLVDAGNGVGYQMARLGKRVGDLTHIVITHHHLDHNVDLASGFHRE
jgi:ribonuclease Z